MKYKIMYIEEKSDIAALEANIGKVYLSKTGKTLRYQDREFQSLKGMGYKRNYYDIETGESCGFLDAEGTEMTGCIELLCMSMKLFERNIGRKYEVCPKEKTELRSRQLENIRLGAKSLRNGETTLKRRVQGF